MEGAHRRSYFYVGGEAVDDGTGSGHRVMMGQMYVERLTPTGDVVHPWPIIFIHGGGQTGTVSA